MKDCIWAFVALIKYTQISIGINLNDLDQFGLIYWCPGDGFIPPNEHQDHADIRRISRLAIGGVGSTGKICAPVVHGYFTKRSQMLSDRSRGSSQATPAGNG